MYSAKQRSLNLQKSQPLKSRHKHSANRIYTSHKEGCGKRNVTLPLFYRNVCKSRHRVVALKINKVDQGVSKSDTVARTLGQTGG